MRSLTTGRRTLNGFVADSLLGPLRDVIGNERSPSVLEDLQPTWLGHSIGRWEGDTLTVDTTGFNDRTCLDGTGRPRTEKLHVIQRIHRVNFGHLGIETTIDDPGTFVKAWTAASSRLLAANLFESHP